jgi:hypothetical protein
VLSYGYNPNVSNVTASMVRPITSSNATADVKDFKPITWGFARSEKDNVAFIRRAMEFQNNQ